MRILHVLSTPRAEGTPNLVLDWLSVPGPRQEVFVLHHAPADLTAELHEKAMWYGEDALFQGRGPCKFLRLVTRVRQVCRERRPDLVVCWPTGFANWVAAGARLALGTRVRILAHCGNPPNRGARADWVSRSVLWPLFLMGGRCASCSDYVRDLYRSVPGVPDRMFETVYNCVRALAIQVHAETARAAEWPAGDLVKKSIHKGPTALMVATMEPHKDHATLLRSLPAVLREKPDFRLWLAGDGSLRPALEALAGQLGVSEAVCFLGARRDVVDWLGRADLFVFSTTVQEGLGSVLLEALAVGLPIVATDCPACREILRAGEFGRLVPPGDPVALAKGMLETLDAGVDAASAKAGQDYSSRFTPERMMGEYLQLARFPAWRE